MKQGEICRDCLLQTGCNVILSDHELNLGECLDKIMAATDEVEYL